MTALKSAKETKDRNALFVKLKTNSRLTVDRKVVDDMAKYFGQDTTFVTHFALARLRDEIVAGRLASAADVVAPIAEAWPTPEEMSVNRQVADKHLARGVEWKARPPELNVLLAEM